MDIKAIKVCKLMPICANIFKLWYLVYNNLKNIKLFDLAYYFFDEYEYDYIRVDKKRANTNINIFGLKKKRQIQVQIYFV